MKVLIPATTANMGPGFDLMGASLNLDNELKGEFSAEYSLTETGYLDGKPFGENLIAQIMLAFFKEHGETRPFKIEAVNQIPFARGLGSSSAAIVGALFLANEMLGCPEDRLALLKRAIAIEGHPDNVAPALFGGVVLSNQDQVLRLPAPVIEACVMIPDFKLETKKARTVLPQQIDHQVAVRNSANLAQLVLALERGDSDLFLASLEDKLHEPYRGTLIPGFFELRELASKKGGKLIISGSGPTLLYLAKKNAYKDAKELSESWSLKNEVVKVQLGSQGVRLAN